MKGKRGKGKGKRVGGSAWGGSAFGVRRRSAAFGGVQRSAFGVRRSAGAVRTSAGVCKSNVAVGRKLRRKIGKMMNARTMRR